MVQPKAPQKPVMSAASHHGNKARGVSSQPASGIVISLGIGMLALSNAMMMTTPGHPIELNKF
ncbi:MAG: hypothetical protein IPM84_13595 [Anaerolineae bacterium]|nr:hypothetical protein [Anaerolineae bacterium]